MKGEGDHAYCEQCRKEKGDKPNPPTSMDVDAASGVDQLADCAVMLRDSGQVSGGHQGGGSMVMTTQPRFLHHLPLGSSFSLPFSLSGTGRSVQQHGEGEPNLAAYLGPATDEDDTGPDIVPIEHMQQIGGDYSGQPFDQLYMPPPTAMGIAASSSHPAFLQPVQDTGGSPLLKELISVSSK